MIADQLLREVLNLGRGRRMVHQTGTIGWQYVIPADEINSLRQKITDYLSEFGEGAERVTPRHVFLTMLADKQEELEKNYNDCYPWITATRQAQSREFLDRSRYVHAMRNVLSTKPDDLVDLIQASLQGVDEVDWADCLRVCYHVIHNELVVEARRISQIPGSKD